MLVKNGVVSQSQNQMPLSRGTGHHGPAGHLRCSTVGSVVRSYWASALRRLQAEVDGFAKLVAHAGEQGRENELALARVLGSLIPARFGTGSGLLIDADDHQSGQVDVVIFEQAMEAALFAQTTQLLYPVEAAYATIEVKTTLTAEDVVEFGEKSDKLRALRARRKHADDAPLPLSCLFAYSSWALPATVVSHIDKLPAERRPDLACVVDQGLLYGRREVLDRESDSEFVAGVTYVYDDKAERVQATEKKVQHFEGLPYSVIRLKQADAALVDAARGLLLFLEALLRDLHRKSDQQPTVLTLYLDDAIKRLDPPK